MSLPYTENWLRCDERKDVLGSLSVCLIMILQIPSNVGLWKWAILSIHNALQGAMACHLSGSAQLGALRKNSANSLKKWVERDRRGEIERILKDNDELGFPNYKIAKHEDNPPDEYLADAATLFERLYKVDTRLETGAGSILTISNSQLDSFRRLHFLRNEFSHFTLKTWSIEVSGLPQIFEDIIEVIAQISRDSWSFRQMTSEERVNLEDVLNKLRAEVMKFR